VTTSGERGDVGSADERLRTDRNVWMCTLRADGSPHVTPIWFVWHDEAFWSCTSSSAVKVRNLVADGRVSLALEDGDDPVVAEAHAHLHRRPYPEAIVHRFLEKYDWDITVPDAEGDWATLLEMRPRRWLLGGP
jgi:F420H(2)-dependent biliverdin reductase